MDRRAGIVAVKGHGGAAAGIDVVAVAVGVGAGFRARQVGSDAVLVDAVAAVLRGAGKDVGAGIVTVDIGGEPVAVVVRSAALIDRPVAVVVRAVAQLEGPRVDLVVAVVAVDRGRVTVAVIVHRSRAAVGRARIDDRGASRDIAGRQVARDLGQVEAVKLEVLFAGPEFDGMGPRGDNIDRDRVGAAIMAGIDPVPDIAGGRGGDIADDRSVQPVPDRVSPVITEVPPANPQIIDAGFGKIDGIADRVAARRVAGVGMALGPQVRGPVVSRVLRVARGGGPDLKVIAEGVVVLRLDVGPGPGAAGDDRAGGLAGQGQ